MSESPAKPGALQAPSDKLERKWIGIRVGYIAVAVACYFGTMLVITNFGTVLPTAEMIGVTGNAEPITVLDQDMVWSALQWLIAAIGGAVLSDMARPSGSKTAAFKVTPKT